MRRASLFSRLPLVHHEPLTQRRPPPSELSPLIVEEVCFGCGLPRGLWNANRGVGCSLIGHQFCCRACYEGGVCECRR